MADQMSKPASNILLIVAMIVVIVGIDLLFFRGRFWPRLIANVGIVLVFIAFYLRYLK